MGKLVWLWNCLLQTAVQLGRQPSPAFEQLSSWQGAKCQARSGDGKVPMARQASR